MSSRKRRDRDASEAEILATASELFAKNGFERTSLADVGAAAGVSRGLPAYLYKDKENLYFAVFKRASEQVRKCVLSTVQALPAHAPIEQVLGSIVESYLDFLDGNPNAVRLLQRESLKPPGRRLKAPSMLFEDAVVVVEQAVKRSGHTGVDARFLLLSIVGMCFFPFGTVNTFKGKPRMLSAYKKHVLEVVMNGIRGAR